MGTRVFIRFLWPVLIEIRNFAARINNVFSAMLGKVSSSSCSMGISYVLTKTRTENPS
jgi:hypothetical protein